MNFKVTFNLDGCGIYYDPLDPIHLDALLAWALAPAQTDDECLMRGDTPDYIILPLNRSKINGHDVWHASALFLDEKAPETLRFWRKKFRQNRASLTDGRPNLQSGVYREYNMPIPLVLANRIFAYGSGDMNAVLEILKKNIKSLGKKRSYGYGKITSIQCEETADDYSLSSGGVSMRWLPSTAGTRNVRPSPPYWNTTGITNCLEVGEIIHKGV